MNSFICAVFLVYILSLSFDKTKAADSSPCGDWVMYKDEKCFKIFENVTLQNYEDAVKTCQLQDNSSSLVAIHSLEEQDFFSNFLFKAHNVVDSVWIGAKNNSIMFKWTDSSELSFTNWATGSPSKTIGNNCVQIIAEGSSKGKWIDVACSKKNLVVCQKTQTWSLSRLQNAFLDFKKELYQNPVPVGFIYVQLPNQPVPESLWPTVGWKDVTSDYAGLFFRAEGGGSAKFETLQNGSAPQRYIDKIGIHDKCGKAYGDYDLPTTGWSDNYETGLTSGSCTSTRFHVNTVDVEVRPINKAVRIWKRTN